MTIKIKAIETRYAGYHFRSRLEARWAVFFDAIGLDWEYEPEGFDLGDGVYYLPDFKVTTNDGAMAWYEIKPTHETHCDKFEKFKESLEKTAELINAPRAVMLCGDPVKSLLENGDDDFGICPRCGIISKFDYGIYRDCGEMHFGCMVCDFYTPCGGGNPVERGVVCKTHAYKGMNGVSFTEYSSVYLPKIAAAATKARSARFEHGQTPTR